MNDDVGLGVRVCGMASGDAPTCIVSLLARATLRLIEDVRPTALHDLLSKLPIQPYYYPHGFPVKDAMPSC